MTGKKGVELSINFIVILILMILVLGLGTTLFTNLFQKTQDFKESVDQNSKQQLNSLLDSGDPVAVLRDVRTVNPGEDPIFNLGVSNELEDESDFKVEITPDNSDPDSFSDSNIIYNDEIFTLQSKQRRYIPFKITVPGNAEGSYQFTVKVKNCSSTGGGCPTTYYNPVKVYLNVR